MKKITKIFCFILCITILSASFPVYAASGDFISFTVETIDADGQIHQTQEIGYTDGNKLYAPISLFGKYTLYYYDDASTSFVRKGQSENSKYGRVTLDYSTKTAKVYMNLKSKDYTLNEIYTFGDQHFLPVDQMSVFLKALVKTNGTTLRILNSGYSIVDAEYALSKISSKDGYLNFGYTHIVDDIYAGSEWYFFESAVLNYFSSKIFDIRLKNIYTLTNVGKIEDYTDFLERCITDNDNYIEAITDNDDLINRVNLAYKANKSVHDYSAEMKSVTSIVKDVSEPLKDESLDHALLYIDARDWNALFSTISDITEFADYYLKLGSMCEDNENIIKIFENYYCITTAVNYLEDNNLLGLVSSDDLPLYGAIATVKNKYGGNLAKSVTTEIGQILADEVVKQGTNIALKEVLPYTAAISFVAKVFKLLGYDLTSNAEYSVLLDLEVKNEISKYYFTIDNSNYIEAKAGTEEYRLAAIFMLLALKQSFKSANTLGKRLDYSNAYKTEIENVNTVLNVFYSAAQSKDFDSWEGITNILEINSAEIVSSSLIKEASAITQDEAISNIQASGNGYFLEATEEELEELNRFVNRWPELTDVCIPYFNYKKTTYTEFICEDLNWGVNAYSPMYDYYFGEPQVIKYEDKNDPLKMFKPKDMEWETGDYYKFSKDNVDWIARNIFNISQKSINNADLNVYRNGDSYYHGGYYYHEIHYGFGDAACYLDVSNYERLDDGRYVLNIGVVDWFDDEYYANVGKAIVAMKNVDEKRQWTIYYIGPANDEFNEILNEA